MVQFVEFGCLVPFGQGDKDRLSLDFQRLLVHGRLYCIVLYLQPIPNPKSYDGARVLEASSRRPLRVKGRSYWVIPIQGEGVSAGTKLVEEITE